MYSLDVLLFLFGTSLLFHVQPRRIFFEGETSTMHCQHLWQHISELPDRLQPHADLSLSLSPCLYRCSCLLAWFLEHKVCLKSEVTSWFSIAQKLPWSTRPCMSWPLPAFPSCLVLLLPPPSALPLILKLPRLCCTVGSLSLEDCPLACH